MKNWPIKRVNYIEPARTKRHWEFCSFGRGIMKANGVASETIGMDLLGRSSKQSGVRGRAPGSARVLCCSFFGFLFKSSQFPTEIIRSGGSGGHWRDHKSIRPLESRTRRSIARFKNANWWELCTVFGAVRSPQCGHLTPRILREGV